MIEKSYLVQKFARLNLGDFHVIGYSIAGEESVVQIPELDVCFDVGRAPWFALTSNILCVTHGHMDHLAGLAYYLSQRQFQGMKPGIVLLPQGLAEAVDDMLKCWQKVERQETPYKLVPMIGGETYAVRKDFLIRAIETHHVGESLAYSLVSVREKLKPEFMGKSGQELANMRKEGVQIQYRIEVPLAAYMGDTFPGPVFDHPDVKNANVLITECTFFDPTHRNRAKIGKHMHVDHLIDLLPKLNNKQIILTHVSRRTSMRRAKSMLKKQVDAATYEKIHFLMDFEGSSDAGDVESMGPKADDLKGE